VRFLPAVLSTHPHHQRHPIPSHRILSLHCSLVDFPLLSSHYTTTLPAFPHPHSLRRCYRSHCPRTFASLPIALVGLVAFEAPQLPTCVASSRELLLPPPATACPGLPTANNTLSVASTLATQTTDTLTRKQTHPRTTHQTYLDPYTHPRTQLPAASGPVSLKQDSCTRRITPRQHFPNPPAQLSLHTAHVIRLARA
jgi:hypothetical protein